MLEICKLSIPSLYDTLLDKFNGDLGRLIKNMRDALHENQETFGKRHFRTKISRGSVANWERNMFRPRGESMEDLMQLINSQGALIGEKEDAPKRWSVRLKSGAVVYSQDAAPELTLYSADLSQTKSYSTGFPTVKSIQDAKWEGRKYLKSNIGKYSEDENLRPFYMQIEGYSMIRAGLIPGMTAVVNPSEYVNEGAIAFVQYATGKDYTLCFRSIQHTPQMGYIVKNAPLRSDEIIVLRFREEDIKQGKFKIIGAVTWVCGRPITQ